MSLRAGSSGTARSTILLWIFTPSFAGLLLLVGVPLCAHWPASRASRITGWVWLEDTCVPVVGARVGLQGTVVRTETDCSGRFCLPGPVGKSTRLVAWKPGHYIAGAQWSGGQPVTLRLRKYPTEDAPDYQWVDPNPDPSAEFNCANCHAEIYRQWSVSSHARSAVNRHFLDAFSGTDWAGQRNIGWNFSQDHPEARAVCSACHLPTVSADDQIAEDPIRATGLTREGIHCDYCHKIADTDAGSHPEFLGLEHGRDALRLVRPAGDQQIFFGPLDDVDRGRDSYSPLYRSSVYCASCHEGTLFGTRVYETFSEWKASSYARRGIECQQCHMKPDGTMRNIAPGHGGIERDPKTLATHQFPGSADESFLRSCVELKLIGQIKDQQVHVRATLRPLNVGHHLPTGSPDRHLLLIVRATNERGQELHQESGPVIPPAGGVGLRNAGNYAGTPGKLFGKLLQGPGGNVPAPFWLAVGVQLDSRLRSDTPDVIEFTFDPDSTGPIQIEATLIYRRFYKRILDEKSWPDEDVILAEQTIEVAVTP